MIGLTGDWAGLHVFGQLVGFEAATTTERPGLQDRLAGMGRYRPIEHEIDYFSLDMLFCVLTLMFLICEYVQRYCIYIIVSVGSSSTRKRSSSPPTPSLCLTSYHKVFHQAGSSLLRHSLHSTYHSIATTILPSRPPPLLPFVTIKALLAQLHIDRIMRLTHPPPKLVSIADPRLIALFHPYPEIVCAYPARVHPAEEADELLCLCLLDECGFFGVVGCHRMQQCPR